MPRTGSTPADAVFARWTDSDAGRPMITHYELRAGSRIELSATSAANWAAKIAGLLRDDLGLAPADRVAVDLPAHWLSPAVLLGVWWAGAEVVTDGNKSGAAVTVTTAERLDRHDSAGEVLVMSTDPMGRAVRAVGGELPVGVVDLVEECRIHPDIFVPSGAGPACMDGLTLTDLGSENPRAERVLLEASGEESGPLLRGTAQILCAGGSLVLVTGATEISEIERIRADERVDRLVRL